MSDATPTEAAIDTARGNSADLLAGLFFVVLGLGVLYASWTMPRLENRGVHPLTVPGLVPGLLALALVICGALLALKARRAGGGAGWRALLASPRSPQAARVLAALTLVLIYTLVLVGWLPFALASALFVFGFIVTFEVALPSEPPAVRRTLAWAAAVALGAGFGVVLVFERVFLVRLP